MDEDEDMHPATVEEAKETSYKDTVLYDPVGAFSGLRRVGHVIP